MGKQTGMVMVCFLTAHVALVLFILSLSSHDWIHGTTHYHLNVTTVKNDSIKPQLDVIDNHTLYNHTPQNHTKHNHTTITLFNVTRTCSKGFWKLCCDEESEIWYNHTTNHTIETSEIISSPVYVLQTNDSNNHSLNWTGCHEVHVMSKNTTGWFRAAMFCCAFSVANIILANVLLYAFLLVTRFKRSFFLVLTLTVLYFVATSELLVSVLIINMHHHKDPDFSLGYLTSLAWSSYIAVAGVCLGAVTSVISIGITIVVKTTASPYETLTVQS